MYSWGSPGILRGNLPDEVANLARQGRAARPTAAPLLRGLMSRRTFQRSRCGSRLATSSTEPGDPRGNQSIQRSSSTPDVNYLGWSGFGRRRFEARCRATIRDERAHGNRRIREQPRTSTYPRT